jgi:hypothetical protein
VPFVRIATVAAVTLLVGLAGCGHDPKPTTVAPEAAATNVPAETATGAPTATGSPAPRATAAKKRVHRSSPSPAATDAGTGSAGLDRFVAAVRKKLPEVTLDRRVEEVEDLGEQACHALAAGRGATAAAGEVAEQGVTPADARTIVGLARNDLCRA